MKYFAWISALAVAAIGCVDQVQGERGEGDAASVNRPEQPAAIANSPAQDAPSKEPQPPSPDVQDQRVIDTTFLPSGTGAVCIIHPNRLLNSKFAGELLKLYPIDPIALVKQQLGFEPDDVDRVIVAMYPDSTTAGAAIVRFRAGFDANRLKSEGYWAGLGFENQRGGGTYYTRTAPPDEEPDPDLASLVPCYWLRDDRTLVFGYEAMIQKMIAANNERSPLIDAIQKTNTDHAVIWITHGIVASEQFANLFAERSLRIVIVQALGGGDESTLRDERFSRIPEAMWGFAEVIERDDSVLTIAVDLEPSIRVRAMLSAPPEAGSQKLLIESENAIRIARSQLQTNRGLLELKLAPLAGYREVDAFLGLLGSPVRQAGASAVTFELNGTRETDSLAIAFIAFWVNRARSSAYATQNLFNLRRITGGFHFYFDDVGRFPAIGNVDNDGNLLLSWRVHVLPYVGEEELYQEFRLDESWNSPHNQQLIARIPKIYQLPGRDADGKTHYLGAAGTGSLFGRSPSPRFRDVIDGATNTVALVCVDDNGAIPWTKPADHVFDPEQPTKGLGMHFRDGYDFGLVDGSSRHFASDVEPTTLRALFTIDAGD